METEDEEVEDGSGSTLQLLAVRSRKLLAVAVRLEACDLGGLWDDTIDN